MADQSSKALAPDENAEAVGDSLKSELTMMLRAFMASAERTKLFMLGGAIAIVIGFTAYGQIKLNAWNKPFYDALAKKDFGAFLDQLLVFIVIVAGLLILNVAQIWLNQMTKLKLRESLVQDLLDQWLGPKRAFRLAEAGEIGVNPDQRIHEDARHLTELSTDLGIGLFQASLLLISFIGVLWILSANVVFTIHERSFSIPGYMVWCALFYAATGSWLSWRVGRPLIPLNAERYAREADLRFALVRINEHTDGIALYGGEADEKRHLRLGLDRVLAVMRRLVTGVTRLTWITAGYGWFAIVAPILVAAPGFFGGGLTLGGLMVVVGAFTQVQQALRWFVDNFSTIADWLATLRRVASFRRALVDMDELGEEVGRIEFVQPNEGKIVLDDLSVVSPAGCAALSDKHVEIGPGEHVLIVGEAGTNLTTLFRAIAGLWLWGSGRISLPLSQGVMFMPQRPYMPLGALRDTLVYPSSATTFQDSALAAACSRVGLGHLSSQLDRSANWDNELASDELQRLAFARLLLHKPSWVCIDEALDSVDESNREGILAIFDAELAGTGVIVLGHRDLREGFSTRVLHLINNPEGPRLTPYVYPDRPAQITKPAASAT
ncbi:ABC transporter ATP-binding protein/permease [Methylocapsa sp. S129]|uniref:ABC transporter ATP-binding protein/permease n=1 Tax=Methylocapsa sp. S129 TaxID=1641869 RepID=UPI00131DAF88|nr:ABC transporter ATP-binding protein/permease [Methylocapsa sp. S129]